jgi:hypothetical protein
MAAAASSFSSSSGSDDKSAGNLLFSRVISFLSSFHLMNLVDLLRSEASIEKQRNQYVVDLKIAR